MGKNWSELTKRHPKHPLLRAEEIYALPETLVDILESKQFLSPDEAVFERDLAQLGGVGFFRKGLFSFPWLPWNDVEVLDAKASRLRQRAEASDAQIKALIRTEIKRAGRNDQQIEEMRRRQEAASDRIRQRQSGYVGWLLTNGEFQNDRHRLRGYWQERPDAKATMPRLAWDMLGERRSRPPEGIAAAEVEASKFLWKWGLSSLATWDLPAPLGPSFVGPSLHSLTDQECAGEVLFIPWHQLVDRDMQLEEVLDLRRMRTRLRTSMNGSERPRLKGGGFAALARCSSFTLAWNWRSPDGIPSGSTAKSRCSTRLSRFLRGRQVDPESAAIRAVDAVRKVRTEMQRRLQTIRSDKDWR